MEIETLPEPNILQERESANSAGENYSAHVVTPSLTSLQIRPRPIMAAHRTNRKYKSQK